jgi:hypothetical protein
MNSRPARTPVTMGSHSAVPNASPNMALQPTALATLSFPQPSESLKSLTPKAVPNISPSQLKSDQDAVAEPFPERARLPTGSADWEAKKEIIREHYMEKNMILNEVMEIMLTKHKFKATYVFNAVTPGAPSGITTD